MSHADPDRRPPQNRIIKYMFEATDFERSRLFLEWHQRIRSWDDRPETGLPTFVQVGDLAGYPVTIRIVWARLDGHLVGFYSAESRLVDHRMIEDWIDKNFCPPMPLGGTHRRKNADNFQNGLLDLGITCKPSS